MSEIQLVHISEGRRLATLRLDEAPIAIGRSSQCDLVLDSELVSRVHATLERVEGRLVVRDEGSSNGTTVNGVRVHDTTVVAPGDWISIANTFELRLEERPDRAGRLPALPSGWLLAVVVLAVVAGVAVWLASGRSDPVMEEAVRHAREAVEARRRGDPADAKHQLQGAVGLMLREGRLSDTRRADVMKVALARLSDALGGGDDLDELFHWAVENSRPAAPEPTQQRCRLDQVLPSDFDQCLQDSVREVLQSLRQPLDSLPSHLFADVGHQLRKEHRFFLESLERGRAFRAMMVRELEAANMPAILHYVAMIESGYRTRARSPAGAAGMWQFMPATARRYGMQVGDGADERLDPETATKAAARYLRDLAFEFGGDAMLLALASYNRGENGVRRALKRLDDPFSDRSYWVLVERGELPRETSSYVTRYLAAAVAGEAGLPTPESLTAAGY